MKLSVHSFDLPLRHPFTISRGTVNVQRTTIVQLEDEGLCGLGEATENAYYGHSVASMSRSVESVRQTIEATRFRQETPEELWERLYPRLEHDLFALAAIDCAAQDLWGRIHGQPVRELWGLSTDCIPESSYTIGIDTIERMREKLREMPDWPIYKIKLGTPCDDGIVRAIRAETSGRLRVDANGAWSVDEAVCKSVLLKRLEVEFIEQPLPAGDFGGMRAVFRESALPLIADESCAVEEDVERCAECFHGINVKLVKCGGLTPARRMLERARGLGLRTMIGCMTESSIGISAAAELLPLADDADLDGAVLLSRDIASGVVVNRGVIHYTDQHGCGARLCGMP